MNRGGWEVIEEKNSEQKITKPLVTPEDNGLYKHAENFIDAIRSNDANLLNCSIEQGGHVAKVAQMGNIAFRSGDKLYWDDSKNGFTDNSINEQYLNSTYHNGYSLPKI